MLISPPLGTSYSLSLSSRLRAALPRLQDAAEGLLKHHDEALRTKRPTRRLVPLIQPPIRVLASVRQSVGCRTRLLHLP